MTIVTTFEVIIALGVAWSKEVYEPAGTTGIIAVSVPHPGGGFMVYEAPVDEPHTWCGWWDADGLQVLADQWAITERCITGLIRDARDFTHPCPKCGLEMTWTETPANLEQHGAQPYTETPAFRGWACVCGETEEVPCE